MIYVVAVERVPNRPVPSFIACLSADGRSFWRMLYNVWLVDTPLSADALYQTLSPHLMQADSLLIIRATDDFAGFLPKPAWDWLRQSKANKDF
jgi:hypothetical protein